MGCFAKGCLTLLIIGFILIAAGIGGTWYVYVRMVNNLTSPVAADVRVEPPSENQFQAAESKLNGLRTAIDKKETTTVEFTAADLNALIARDPDFSDWRGHVRIEIADSTMTVAMSAPLSAVPLPRMKKRWFNGMARFSFVYESGAFAFDIKSAEAAGHQLPDMFLSSSSLASFNESMNQNFRNGLKDNDRSSKFWENVKKMSLDGDKLVVTTEPE
jgi:hypothetical protein